MPRFLVLAILAAWATWASAAPGQTGSIRFSGGRLFETGVYRPKLLAELPVPGALPYLVFSGFGCDECDININIFIRSAGDGPIERPELDTRHVYPGTYRTYDTDELVQKVRAFVGRCTRGEAYGVVWFLDMKFENGTWRKSTYVAEIENGKLTLRQEPGANVTLDAARAAVSKRVCREIPGMKLTTEP